MASKLARSIQSVLARSIFWSRRRFLEPTLDPAYDSVILPAATYSPWLQDAEFRRVRALIEGHTLVDVYRCWELWHLVRQVADVPGDILEVGVWRGGTAALMAVRAKMLGCGAGIHLCDTFEGVVKTTRADAHYTGGEHSDTSVQIVETLLKQLGIDRATIHAGIFPESAPPQLEGTPLRMAHIDVDVYESGRQSFEWIWPRVSPGGVVIFDDFSFSTTRDITTLCNELQELPMSTLLQNLNGHAIIVKTG
jgi:O-methyltransferase